MTEPLDLPNAERLHTPIPPAPSPAAEPSTTETADDAGPFICPECSREFSSLQGMRSHLTRSHGANGARKRRARKPAPAPVDVAKLDTKLLALVFPNGRVPIAQLTAVARWLDDAHRLAASSD